MIKSSIHIILLILLQTVALSQDNPLVKATNTGTTDSLKQILASAKDDSSRMSAMNLIGFNYEPVNVDSSMKYTQAALALARARGYTWAEAQLMINLASVTRQQGKLAEAIDILFKSLKIAEANKLPQETGRAYRRLSDVYFDLDNFPKAVDYLLLALKVDEANLNKNGAAVDHMSLGYAYVKVNKLDSAIYHTDIAVQQKDRLKRFTQYIYQAYGNIQMNKGNYEEAAFQLRQGYTSSQEHYDLKTASNICADLAALFIKLNKKDSAIYYATTAYSNGVKASSKKSVMIAGSLLAQLYDSTEPAVAFKYYKIAAAAKDSLFGIDNIQTIQNLVSREETRQKELDAAKESFRTRLKLYGLLTGLAVLLIIAFILLRNNRNKQKANVLLQQQKEKIEITLQELKSTQAQLIQSEKMASLGELTAGIAHEIQNPLNFVNNFSDVNTELLQELKSELSIVKSEWSVVSGENKFELSEELLNDLEENEKKINHHGKRADAIVKGMLQHSRSGTGHKEPTDINALADEYLRLAYQGLRAKDKSFNATIKTEFDNTIGKINIIPQDIGRVLLNLYNNAFYAAPLPPPAGGFKDANYKHEPTVWVSAKKIGNIVEIRVKDNGPGISEKILDKIFQPFFTTKPTGQGTGLGLSLSYDIVKAHGGEIKVESKAGEGSTFIVLIPA